MSVEDKLDRLIDVVDGEAKINAEERRINAEERRINAQERKVNAEFREDSRAFQIKADERLETIENKVDTNRILLTKQHDRMNELEARVADLERRVG